MSDITVHKDSIRRKIRAHRDAYCCQRGRPHEGEHLLLNWQRALTKFDIHPSPQHPVAAFYPMEKEPDITGIVGAHNPILLPVLCQSDGHLLKEVAWSLHTREDSLIRPNPRFPAQSTAELRGPEAIATASVVLVAGLAVDRAGTRLGQGGGWYDRALRFISAKTPVIACVFDWEYTEELLPHEAHDMAVDGVLTPTRFIDLKAQ